MQQAQGAQQPPPKRKRGTAANGQDDCEEEEGGEAQRRRAPSGKRQGSSQGRRRTAQQVLPDKSGGKKQRPPKPAAAKVQPVPAHTPAQVARQPMVAAQQAQQAGQLAAGSPQGPTSPLPEARPPEPMPLLAAASRGQRAATGSAAWRVPSSQLDWDALLAPSAAPPPLPPLGAAIDPAGGSSHASWPALSGVGAAELEELCQIQTPLFPEWERLQPGATALAGSSQPAAAGTLRPAAAPACRPTSPPPLPVAWQSTVQSFMRTSPAAPAAQPAACPAPLLFAGPAGQQAIGLPSLPGAPPLQCTQWPRPWPQMLPHECQLPVQQLRWHPAWLEEQLSAAASAAHSAAISATPPFALPAAAAAGAGIGASSPACGMATWQPAQLR